MEYLITSVSTELDWAADDRKKIGHGQSWAEPGTAGEHVCHPLPSSQGAMTPWQPRTRQPTLLFPSRLLCKTSSWRLCKNTEKGSKVGEKRSRTTFSSVQKVYLDNALDKGELNTPEQRQQVAHVFSKETGKSFDTKAIDNWWRNHKKKGKTAVIDNLEDSGVSVREFTSLVRMMKYVCEHGKYLARRVSEM